MILSDATLQKWRTETEGQFFDRKSARLAPKELASHISAFANASGGTVVLGIENSGEVTGVNRDQENSLRQAGMDFLEILPEYKAELISTADGIPLLVLTVQPSHNIIIKTKSGDAYLLSKEGVFVRIPEYPPFTWLEGLVNAVTHRDYSIQGDYIRISMFDDRLEFSSPGSLPSIVTVENIQNTRFSRNPMIARVLSDFGWVRELNEGVKRIYQDMRSYFLDPPVYQVLNRNTVCLTLKNNIAARSMRRLESGTAAWEGKWSSLAPLEQEIIYYLANVSKCTPKLLMELTDKSRPTINRHIKCLMESGLVVEHAASASDPTKYYELATTLK